MSELCQSCGIPFNEEHKKFIAKEPNGNNSDYCIFCYKDGKFIHPDLTLEEMINMCLPHLAMKMGEESAKKELTSILPTLLRWK